MFAAPILPQELLRRMFGGAPIGVGVFDTAMRCITADGRLREEMPAGGGDPIGRNFYDVFPQTPPHWRDAHRRCLAGAVEQYDGEPVVHTDGTVAWDRWICWPWCDRNGAIGGLVLMLERATDAARRQRDARHWSDAVEHAGFGITIVDPHDNTLLYANRAFAEQHGMPPAQVWGNNIFETYPQYERERVAALLAVGDAAGNIVFEATRMRRNGSEFPAMMAVTTVHREDGSTPYRIGTILDVSEYKRTAAALRASETRFRSYFDNSPVAVFVLDAAETIVDCNPAACTMFRSEAAALQGQHVRLLHRADDTSVLVDHFATLRREGRTQREYQMQRPDGTTFWAIVSTALLPDDGSIGFMQDIDQLKQAEAQQRRTHRLTLLGEMAAGLAHELKQPLSVISMATEYATELLTVDRDIDGAAAELRGVIEQAGRAAEIIGDVQLFGRAEINTQTPSSVANALGGTLSMVHGRLQETATAVVQSLPPDLPKVMLARVKLEQVLSNLILNACDAYAEDDTAERLIAIVAWRDGPDVVITVADRAGGILGAVLPRVFDPFFTTKPEGQGVGLGLSIVYGIVTGAGGHLAVRNEDGGALFEFRLPAYLPAC